MPDSALEVEALALFDAWLDVPEGDRAAWLAAHTDGRPELRARFDALRMADSRASLRTGHAAEAIEDDTPPPERIGAYRLAEQVGRGGMGAVYRAERDQGDFGHVVAIKIIKPGLLSERLIERFRRERQILAQLSHPGIAHLIDGGETDGSPYIVMEYVDGRPLPVWIDEARPDADSRLRLFEAICEAVAFAHGHLVVHRDITPSNVLVTREGRAKLIDFGISRPVEQIRVDEREDVSVPSLQSLSLTPGYAAPERMTSLDVSTAADVYSLGKLLEMLAGERGGDTEIAAIVRRATAHAAEDRYATVQALAADVAAARTGFPVAALGGGRGYVARKFVRRHWIGATLTAAATLLLVTALGVTLASYARAERQRALAEQRYEQTRAIAKVMLFDAFDAVSKVPGATDARQLLAASGLQYLEALSKDASAPVDVRSEAGRGYVRLAEVTGSGQANQLGRYEDAAALLAQGERILAPLHRAHPQDPVVTAAYAALLLEQSGQNLYNNNEPAIARKQALAVRDLMRGTSRRDADSARLFAVATQAVGDSYGWDNDYARALPYHAEAEQFLSGLPNALRTSKPLLAARSANLRLLSEALHKVKREPDALAAIAAAVAVNRQLVAGAPEDPTFTRKLALSLWYQAVLLRSNDRLAEARRSADAATELAAQLRARSPGDEGALSLFAAVGEVQAQVLADLGAYPESYRVTDAVLAAQRERVRLAGDAPGALRSYATVLSTSGTNHYNGRDYPGACRLWRQSLDAFETLEGRGKLTETDRKNGMATMRDMLKRGCENGPPRWFADQL